MIEGILWRYRTGSPWRDLPTDFGPWQTVWARHRAWSEDGTWDEIHTTLMAQADAAGVEDWSVNVDSTINRAHQHSTTFPATRGAPSNYKNLRTEPDNHGIGRRRNHRLNHGPLALTGQDAGSGSGDVKSWGLAERPCPAKTLGGCTVVSRSVRLRGNYVASAGWLMAELSLILMIVMIGSQTPLPAVADPVPTPTPSLQPKPDLPVGLVTEPRWFNAPVDQGLDAAAASLADQVAHSGIRPGLILLWGIGSEREGTAISAGVRTPLQPRLNAAVDPDPAIRAYYKGASSQFVRGRVYAEIFYFSR